MIFTANDTVFEYTFMSLPTGWTYLDEAGRESSMAEELFDGTFFPDSVNSVELVEVFVTEGLLLW